MKRLFGPYLIVVAFFLSTFLYSCEVKDEFEPTPVFNDSVSPILVKEITPYSALITGHFVEETNTGEKRRVGVRYSLQNTRFLANTGIIVYGDDNGDGTHSVRLDELFSDTTYYFMTFYEVEGYQHHSQVYSFRTHKLTVRTDSVTNVYAFGAQFGLTLSEDIDTAKFKGSFGVYYSSRPRVLRESSELSDSMMRADNLLPNYTYYYRAFVLMHTATTRDVYLWGDILEFKTPSVEVQTLGHSDVSSYFGTLSGSVNVRFNDVEEMGILLFNRNRDITIDSVGKKSDHKIVRLAPTSFDPLGYCRFHVSTKTLIHDTWYYYRAYAKVRTVIGGVPYVNTHYGDVLCFKSAALDISESDAVDLGLSVRWAAKNVGAAKIEDLGSFYSFNDQLSISYSDGWRRPTYVEAKELVDSCFWTWTTYNNCNGVAVTGPNGNSIFLPANNKSGKNYTYGVYMQTDSVNSFAGDSFVPSIIFLQDILNENECGKSADNMLGLEAPMSVRLVKE